MAQQYKYFAFISYSRKDSKIAAWLQKRLEWFRFPVKLVPENRRPPDPRYVRPVYRDKTNLEVTDEHYWNNLHRALEKSRFLIILCSPHSSKSNPVDKEVAHFLATHEDDTSLLAPIIVSGNVQSTGDDAALCPNLRSLGDRLLTRNIITMVPDDESEASDGWESGFASLIAYLLQLDRIVVGDHIQRETKRQAAKQREIAERERKLSEESQRAKEDAEVALAESQRQLERSQLEEGRAWLERAKAALNKNDHLTALMLAGRAVGYQGHGRLAEECVEFENSLPLLLGGHMSDSKAEQERLTEMAGVHEFLAKICPSPLPLWAAVMGKGIVCIAFSPDGTRLACGSYDETIKLYDCSTGKEVAMIAGHTNAVTCLAFSPDGRFLASGSSDRTIKLWDASCGKELGCFCEHTNMVSSLAFSPDGNRLASSFTDIFGSTNEIKLWEFTSGKELAHLGMRPEDVGDLVFSPDGTRLASGGRGGTIKLWDSFTGKELTSFTREEVTGFQGHTKWVTSVAFSCEGSRLACGYADGVVKVWDTSTYEGLATFNAHKSTVHSVVFSPDARYLASASYDKTIKLWDFISFRLLISITVHTKQVNGVSFSPDSRRFATISDDNSIKVWATTTGKEFRALVGHTNRVTDLVFSLDGSFIASSSYDNTIKLWDVATGKELITLNGHIEPVESLGLSPDGRWLVSTSWDKTIKLWDVATGNVQTTIVSRTTSGRRVRFSRVVISPDGSRISSGSDDNIIKLWGNSGKELASLQGHTYPVNLVAFSPNGERLVSISKDNTTKLWDTASGNEISTVTAEELAVASQWLASDKQQLSPNQQLIAVCDFDTIYLTPNPSRVDLTAPLRVRLLAFADRELQFPEIKKTTPMLHVRQDTLAQLADPNLTTERYAELRMELCTKSSQFRAATELWQRLLQGEWPGFEGATVPKDQAPGTIPADSPIRRLYLLALIDATKHPQIHGHATICQTASQIAPVLTKEMMATPTISLAMMSLMQTLAKDENAAMNEPRAALIKKLEEVATKEWLSVLRETMAKQPQR